MARPNVLDGAKRLVLALGVSAGLLLSSVQDHAAPSQAETIGGLDTADQAYRELAAKNYTAAIRDLQKALAANPSKSDWRKDLGYAFIAAGFPKEAAEEFGKVYREHPEDLGVALELGYLSQQLSGNEAAMPYFEAAARSTDSRISEPAREALVNARAAQLQARKQKAYDLLAQGRRSEARELFEAVHRVDPADAAVTMQLGYLYASDGELSRARALFEAERENADSKVATQATTALREIHQESKLWFGSVYATPFYQARFSNQIYPFNFQVGLRPVPNFQPYVSLLFSRDLRSQTGSLPQIFSDNSLVVAAGVQSPILGKGTELYAQAGTATSLLSQPSSGRAVPDYRAGMTWFKSWGPDLNPAVRNAERGASLAGSAYANVAFYSRYDHNVIGYLQLREGVNLPTKRVLPVQVLAALNYSRDSNSDFYNNVVEVGPGVRVLPFRRLPNVQLVAQYVWGFYTIHDPTNPYGPRYNDFRVFLIWSRNF
jgi:tetratricopeptide (TPR) repeat protein